MEDDLDAIKNWATTLMLLASDDGLQETPFPGVLLQISHEIDRRVKAVFERRSELWKLTHPSRAEF